MITPRRTRLLRVPDLQAFRRVIGGLVPRESTDSLILVPTQSAARQLARTVLAPPASLVTRDELYDVLLDRLSPSPRRLSAFERDCMMQASAHEAADPPFPIRAGLISEMLRFYDQLRRQSQAVSRFRSLMEGALGGGIADADRGAERLLRQTRFLADTFAGYERSVGDSGAVDEHTLRDRLLAGGAQPGITHVVVTVPDWIADPDGLFVADFDLLSRLPGLTHLDIVCTEAVLGSGFHERLHDWWPGIEEENADPALLRTRPQLIAPAGSTPEEPWFTYRDREEELRAAGRRLSMSDESRTWSLERTAVVFKRPLPYLYLAPETFALFDIPFQASDALPLAAEPAAAAVDLVLDALETGFTRPSLVALLRSPHFRTVADDQRPSVSALDRFLSQKRYLGEIARLESLDEIPTEAQAAFDAALALARELAGMMEPALASSQIVQLKAVLDARFRPIDSEDPFAAREGRARETIDHVLAGMASAYAGHYDPIWSVEDLAVAVRRWIGDQTFLRESQGSGVLLLDDQAARYADVDDMTLVGLVENEWPERPRRNIFYPGSLLKALGWPSEKDRRNAAEARFLDLLGSASTAVRLSTFTLEDEALVTRSILLDEVPRARLSIVAEADAPEAIATPEAPDLKVGPTVSPAVVNSRPDLQVGRSASDPRFHGSLGPQASRTWSVSSLETYLDCPFRFFAQHVLRLQEEPEEEEVMDPRRQGQFVHDVFEQFFTAWKTAGHQAITPANLNDARRLFADVVERALERLPGSEAGLERTRLLGSSAAAGLGEAVLRMEAERPVAVVERLLEHSIPREVTIQTEAGSRVVSLRGRVDRIDLLADGSFRLIDYKLGWPPNRARALQLPIYGLAARQQLSAKSNRPWTLGEAVYVAFKGPRRVVPLFTSPAERDEVLAGAQQRLSETIDAIERGEFPPTPDDVYRCETCSYASVCRKDYVGDI